MADGLRIELISDYRRNVSIKLRNATVGLVGALFGVGVLAPAADAAPGGAQSPTTTTAINARIRAAAASAYRPIVNKAYEQCIDVNRASTDPSVQLQITGCNGTGAQGWLPVLISGNTYYLANQNSGQCMDVRNASTLAGAAVQQFPCHGSDAQFWA